MAARKSFFSSLFGKPAPPPPAEVVKAQEEDSEDEHTGNEPKEVIEAEVEIGCARGWPSSATVVAYHENSGVICVGTEAGAVYVYGDGFQFVRPWLTADPNEVVAIVPLHPNKIMVAFGDNSLVAMELPSLEVVDLLSSSWLPQTYGDLTCVYSDLVGEKNFVYLGTSEGIFLVLDVMETMIRAVDFQLTVTDFGLGGKALSISDILLSPKDEKYVTVGFDSAADDEEGHVVIYDLVKHKTHKAYAVPLVTSLAWDHKGDHLFAGTRNGQVFMINPDKNTCQQVWSAENELIGSSDEYDSQVGVRRLSWLAAQSHDGEGVLFVQLANQGADNDCLQNVIVGLQVSGEGEMSVVFALPPVSGEKIVSFKVVPTYDKVVKSQQQNQRPGELVSTSSNSSIQAGSMTTPGLLLLTQKQDGVERGYFRRDLKLLRCPTTAMSDWGLEIGTLGEPRKAIEVQPTAEDISIITGITPNMRNPFSLGRALLLGAAHQPHSEDPSASTASFSSTTSTTSLHARGSVSPTPSATQSPVGKQAAVPPAGAGSAEAKHVSRRLSYRAFMDHNNSNAAINISIGEMDLAGLNASLADWEMVLVHGEHAEHISVHATAAGMRRQDVVFLGQEDGSVVAFGVSRPMTGREIGRGGIWMPLTVLRCGQRPITAVNIDETCGLVAAADERGEVVVFQVMDPEVKVGSVDLLHRWYEKTEGDAAQMAQDATTVLSLDDFPEGEALRAFHSMVSQGQYRMAGVEEAVRLRVAGNVTSLKVLGEFLAVVIGTEEGSIFVQRDLRTASAVTKVEQISLTGASGAVKGLTLGYFPHNETLLTAIYAYFESGHVLVIDLSTLSIVSFSVAMKMSTLETPEEHALYEDSVDHMAVLGQNDDGQVTLARAPQINAYLYCQARKKLQLQQQPPHEAEATAGRESHAQSVSEPSAEAAAAAAAAATQAVTPPKSRVSFFGSRKSIATVPPPAPPATSPSAAATSTASTPAHSTSTAPASGVLHNLMQRLILHYEPHHLPRQLMFLHGTSLFAFALDRFMPVNKRRESFSSVAKGAATGVTIRKIASNKKLVSSQIMRLRASDDTSGEFFVYAACLDVCGTFRLISLQTRSVVNISGLVDGLAEETTLSAFAGLILPNGSTYVVNHGTIVYSASISFSDCIVQDELPERANPSAKPLQKSLALVNGREAIVAKLKQDVKKRRSSVISLTAAPTDLHKIFAKSRDQRLKDTTTPALFERETSEETPARRAQRSAPSTKLKDDLGQLKDGLNERGERISRLALKMDDFKESAAQFKQQAAAHKERLRQSNRAWGLF